MTQAQKLIKLKELADGINMTLDKAVADCESAIRLAEQELKSVCSGKS